MWGNRTRLLLPSAETLPSNWKSRRETFGAAVCRQWDSWRVAPATDAARVSFDLSPCRIWSRNVRIPMPEGPRYAGVQEPWWGRRGPYSHTSEPMGNTGDSLWVATKTMVTTAQPYVGRGELADGPASALGASFLPDCEHEWRTVGPRTEWASPYAVALDVKCGAIPANWDSPMNAILSFLRSTPPFWIFSTME